jgi:hypothetical protein
MVASRERLRRSKAEVASQGMPDGDKILDLDARVVCAGDWTKEVEMCKGCIGREVRCLKDDSFGYF